MEEREELRLKLEDYLRQKGIRTTKPFRCLNPKHEDKHPSMSLNRKNATAHCFACGATYDIFDLVGFDYGLTGFPEQLQKTATIFYMPAMPTSKPRIVVNDGTGLVDEADELNRMGSRGDVGESQRCGNGTDMEHNCDTVLQRLKRYAVEGFGYFEARGITAELCRKYGLFQDAQRAYMPIWEGTVCTGYCSRARTDTVQPRYKNSTGSLGIWNSDSITKATEQVENLRIYIVEGIINALTLEQLGYRALALCGSQNTGKLLRLCARQPVQANRYEYVACGDDDEAGHAMDVALTEGLAAQGLCCRVLALTGGDINEIYLREPQRLSEALEAVCGEEPVANDSAGGNLDAFFAAAAEREPALSTGLPALDRVLDGGLYSGLYVIGAISSVGKTSFALQLGDAIAAHGRDVLFFSLEQSKFELIAKSLSRTSAQLDVRGRRNAFTARQLLRGWAVATDKPNQAIGGDEAEPLLLKTKAVYAQCGARLFLREGVADIGAAEIRDAVRSHIARRGTRPVVIVDYLQILKPLDPRATDKQNVDRTVVELKRISRDFDTPVVAISSFNRDNYRNAVSMEAFKESGAVEYSSDVLMGLQLAGAGEKGFDVNAAKSREPRDVEIVLLKNRNGVPYAKVKLDYFARFNLFEEKAKSF